MELREGVPSDENLAGGGRQGANDFRRLGYGGPCPPGDAPHRYIFTVFALAGDIELEAGATKEELLAAIDGLVLYQGELMGRYGRSGCPGARRRRSMTSRWRAESHRYSNGPRRFRHRCRRPG